MTVKQKTLKSVAMVDVIIIGLGGMGSAAAFELASAGLTVLGLEQFEPIHDKGSSFGQTRMIRKAYMEGDFYIPLLERAYEKWHELSQKSGQDLINICGGLYVGAEDDPVVADSILSAKTYDIPVEILNGEDIKARFPPFHPKPGDVGAYEPSAGYIKPNDTIRFCLKAAVDFGATLNFGEEVKAIQRTEKGIEIATTKGFYRAKKLVLTTGPWMQTLLGEMGTQKPLTLRRMVLHWFQPEGEVEAYQPPHFVPNLVRTTKGSILYGFPWTPEEGAIKYAFHDRFQVIDDLANLNRKVLPEEVSEIEDALQEWAPGVCHKHLTSKICLYTMTPDEHFMIGTFKKDSNVVVAGGFSGHGFKFAPVVGEIVKDLVMDQHPPFDLAAFDLDRF